MAKESKSTTPEADLKKDTKAAAVPVKETKPAETKKEETKKEEVKTEVVKKEAESSEKKSQAKTKKSSNVKKEPLTPEMFVQYDDPAGAQEANVADIVAKVKAVYVAQGHRESSIKSLQIYMKPQMWKAYYVINHKIEGDVDLF